MKFRKSLPLFSSVSLIALILAGCGTSTDTSTTAQNAAPAEQGSASAENTAQMTTASQTSTAISENDATKIALDDAGFKKSEVTNLVVSLDVDDDNDDPTVYDVEFTADGSDYDYEINAATGEILSRDVEESKAADIDNALSTDEVKKIALDNLGFKESDVTNLKVEVDDDDGRAIYEVEFRVSNTEYSYEIDAQTGEIVSSESEIED